MTKNRTLLWVFAILLGICAGISENATLTQIASLITEIFLRLFKLISIPIIFLSLVTTLSNSLTTTISRLLKLTALFTLGTTIVSASVTAFLYFFINPQNVMAPTTHLAQKGTGYMDYLIHLVPENLISPFLESKVISVLFLGLLISFAIRYISDQNAKNTVINFFKGSHALFFILTGWLVSLLPIGLFGFITVSILQIKQGVNLSGIGKYLTVIVLANLIQGLIILPLWLKTQGIKPFDLLKKMLPALSVAFFSKSSAGTLPITIKTAENKLGIDPKISQFVLPLCTTINMNGCAAFILATVLYLMQNYGVPITPITMIIWVLVATIAAIGNAGVPMGCFFLSASLLSSMDIPIVLMGIILPFYNLIDMVETTLNVWSDTCVTAVIHRKTQSNLTVLDSEIKPSILL